MILSSINENNVVFNLKLLEGENHTQENTTTNMSMFVDNSSDNSNSITIDMLDTFNQNKKYSDYDYYIVNIKINKNYSSYYLSYYINNYYLNVSGNFSLGGAYLFSLTDNSEVKNTITTYNNHSATIKTGYFKDNTITLKYIYDFSNYQQINSSFTGIKLHLHEKISKIQIKKNSIIFHTTKQKTHIISLLP